MSDHSRERHAELVESVVALTPSEGLRDSSVPGFRAFRSDSTTDQDLAEYPLSLCVAVQGRKRVQVGDETYVYEPLTCLLVALPLPLYAQIVEASPENPFLAVVLEIDTPLLAELELSLDPLGELPPEHEAVRLMPVEGELLDSLTRLCRASADPIDGKILGTPLKREVIYRLLQSEHGGLLRSLAARDSRTRRVQSSIQFIRQNFEKRLSVQDIAAAAHMSESTFFEAFKHATSLSPLQYLKRYRLQKARDLLLAGRVNASQAALAVGYQSPSQFSREFKSAFGAPPSQLRAIDA